jgi:DNA-binding SARP family transcriptional activator
MEFGLLGPLTVRDGGKPVVVSAPRQRALLAALLLSAGTVVAFDDLAELVWDGQPPRAAREALHSAMQRLRSSLGRAGRDLVRTCPPGYLIELGENDLDVRRFGQLAAQGRAAAAAGKWPQAADVLREALGLWRGEPLADVPSQLLRAREVPYLTEQRLEVLASRIDADLHLGRHSELVAELRHVVTQYPLREHFHAQHLLALYRSERQADALAAYQDVRQLLNEELGVDPGPDLERLHQRILTADPELLLPAGGQPGISPSVPPARISARPPGPADAHVPPQAEVVPAQLPGAVRHFIGRAAELKELMALLNAPGGGASAVVISAIDGTAGIGKTALAVHFAHQVSERFPDGQLYVNLRGYDPSGPPVTTAEVIRGFLDAVAVRLPRIPASVDAQAALYRSILASRRMLVVLDNARDAGQVRPLLPGSPACL